MRELKFFGVSDDLLEIRGTRDDEPSELCGWNKPIYVLLEGSEGKVCITAMYHLDGGPPCWSIGLTPAGEGEPIPGWYIKWDLYNSDSYLYNSDSSLGPKPGCEYSPLMTMAVPEDVKVCKYNG